MLGIASAFMFLKDKLVWIFGAIMGIAIVFFKFKADRNEDKADREKVRADTAEASGDVDKELITHKYEHEEEARKRDAERKENIESGVRNYFSNDDGGM